jgi:transposase
MIKRGSAPSPALPVSARQYRLLEEESRRRTTLHQYKERIEVILMCSQGLGKKTVARLLGQDIGYVKRWHSRWALLGEELESYERGVDGKGVNDYELLAKMLELLSDRPRSGKPRRISDEQEDLLRAMACRSPEDYGIIRTEWSHKTLAEAAVREGIFEHISRRYVSVLLKKSL